MSQHRIDTADLEFEVGEGFGLFAGEAGDGGFGGGFGGAPDAFLDVGLAGEEAFGTED